MKYLATVAVGLCLLTPPAAFAEEWSGWYGGASLGYGDVSSSLDGLDGSGVIGGLLGGYRYDYGDWVVGVEADYDWASIDLNDTIDASLDSVYRLKLQGGADLGQTFLYATAGWAWADATVGPDDLSSDGWFAGVGLDYAIDEGWLVGGEILFHQFDDFDSTGIDVDATTFKARIAYRF